MYERQSYEADGRHRFWGGLAVGVVDGGRGLIDQHAAAAEAHGIEVRHDAAVEELVDGGVVVPDGTVRRCARARSSWRRAASSPTRRCARRTSGRTGTWRRCAARRTTPARCCSAALRRGAQPYGNWSGCHAIQWDRDAPRDRRPGADQPLLAPVVSGRDRRQPRRRALHRRGRGLPQLHLREVRRRGAQAAAPASRSRSSTPARCRCCGRSTTRRRAPTRGRCRHRSASSRRSWGSTPSGSSGPCASSTPRSFPASSTRRSRTGSAPRGWPCRSPTGRCRSRRRRSRRSRSRAGSRSRSAALRVDADARVLDLAGRPLPGLLRRRRARRRPVLPQLPRRLRADRGHGLRTPGRVRRRNYGIGRR